MGLYRTQDEVAELTANYAARLVRTTEALSERGVGAQDSLELPADKVIEADFKTLVRNVEVALLREAIYTLLNEDEEKAEQVFALCQDGSNHIAATAVATTMIDSGLATEEEFPGV